MYTVHVQTFMAMATFSRYVYVILQTYTRISYNFAPSTNGGPYFQYLTTACDGMAGLKEVYPDVMLDKPLKCIPGLRDPKLRTPVVVQPKPRAVVVVPPAKAMPKVVELGLNMEKGRRRLPDAFYRSRLPI